MSLTGHFLYIVVVVLMMTGLYVAISRDNLVKRLIGLNLFQTSIFIMFIRAGKVRDGVAPILKDGVEVYSNPLPHVLILTAIVVSVATLAVGLALVMRIYDAYGTIEEQEIHSQDPAL